MIDTARAPAVKRKARGRRLRLRHAVLALVVAACGGTTGKRIAGGESHFLETCRQSCDSGLECVSGLCTRRCETATSDCSDLSPLATCTGGGELTGVAAVCDVSCDRDRDCGPLGDQFRCPAGFCRVGVPPDGSAGAPSFSPECSPALDFKSECSFEETCAELNCGDGFSQFGADGCTRYCRADADCAAGQRCRHTVLATDEDCPVIGSEVEGCLIENGKCSCSTSADCDWPSICVDAVQFPVQEDCAVGGLDCAALDRIEAAADTASTSSLSSELRAQAEQCFARVGARRRELGCGPNRLIPFAPQCDPEVTISSSCGFEATCQALGCGDGLSQFDENGCTRYCETSTDCAAGQRCRHTRLVLSDEECPSLGSEVESCSLVDDACECDTTLDCPRPDICVDAAKYPESLDCAVEAASCQALAYGEFQLQELLDGGATGAAASEAQTCLDAIRARQQVLGCP